MSVMRTRPGGRYLASLGATLAVFSTLPNTIGYQDLAALLASQPAVANRWRKHIIASPFGTIHAATFSFPRPIGTLIPQPLQYRLASFDTNALDVTGSVRSGPDADPVLGPPPQQFVFPKVDRSLKGDRLVVHSPFDEPDPFGEMPVVQPAPQPTSEAPSSAADDAAAIAAPKPIEAEPPPKTKSAAFPKKEPAAPDTGKAKAADSGETKVETAKPADAPEAKPADTAKAQPATVQQADKPPTPVAARSAEPRTAKSSSPDTASGSNSDAAKPSPSGETTAAKPDAPAVGTPDVARAAEPAVVEPTSPGALGAGESKPVDNKLQAAPSAGPADLEKAKPQQQDLKAAAKVAVAASASDVASPWPETVPVANTNVAPELLPPSAEKDPTTRVSRLLFGADPLGPSRESIEPWEPGKAPTVLGLGTDVEPDTDIKSAAHSAAPKVASLAPAEKPESVEHGQTVAKKGEVNHDDKRSKSPAERLKLTGKARVKAEKCLADAVYFEVRAARRCAARSRSRRW